MILTAIVQTKDGTLVVDLPRDRIDLEMKIRSVGIERLSDQIRIIDDEEKSDISVKLFGESDIGRHLSLLFNENHTLFEVNKTLQFVANSVEDIRDDLEMNIIHDQYDSPAELVGDIERMTDEVGQYTETFYFPLVGNMEDDDDGEQYEVGNRYLRYYEYEIRELLQKEQDLDGTNMKDYFYDDDNAQKKMVSCQWDIVDRSNTLYGKVDFRLKEPFTAEEKELASKLAEPMKTVYLSMPSDGEIAFDALSDRIGTLDGKSITTALSRLSVLGLVESLSGERYKRVQKNTK